MPKNVALSSWKRQSFSGPAVKAALQELSLGVLSHDEMAALRMYFTRLQARLAFRAGAFRCRMLQAAQVYFRRFYLKVTMAEYDPYLIAVSCLYLASKACEGMIAARIWADKAKLLGIYSCSVSNIVQAEIWVLDVLECSLVPHLAVRTINQLGAKIKLSESDTGPSSTQAQIIRGAFTILAEVYHTDIPLTFASSIIAATCLNMSASMKRIRIENALSAAVGLDWEEVATASEQLVCYFEKHTSQNKNLLFLDNNRASEYLRRLKDAYQRKLESENDQATSPPRKSYIDSLFNRT